MGQRNAASRPNGRIDLRCVDEWTRLHGTSPSRCVISMSSDMRGDDKKS